MLFIRNSCSLVVLYIVFTFALPSFITSDIGVPVAQAQTTTLPAPHLVSIAPLSPATSNPGTSSPQKQIAAAVKPKKPAVAAPTSDDRSHLVIPSIGINAPIDPVGVNSLGQMAVPSGSTKDVGWYKYGTVPGDVGSAVIDAHVFAGFAALHNIGVGDSIYVVSASGEKLRFVVQEVETYALADVPSEKLFAQEDAAHLNLITCAGQLTPDHSTYDHRLVVYAVLAGNASG